MMTLPVTRTKTHPRMARFGRDILIPGKSSSSPMVSPPNICAPQYSAELSDRERRVNEPPLTIFCW